MKNTCTWNTKVKCAKKSAKWKILTNKVVYLIIIIKEYLINEEKTVTHD